MKHKQGFPKKCRSRGWTVKKWERCLTKVEKENPEVNKYAICNSKCLGYT